MPVKQTKIGNILTMRHGFQQLKDQQPYILFSAAYSRCPRINYEHQHFYMTAIFYLRINDRFTVINIVKGKNVPKIYSRIQFS